MADTNVTTRCLPTAGDIWVKLAREERTYHLYEAVEDQKRRIEFVDAKIREITKGRGASSPDQERK